MSLSNLFSAGADRKILVWDTTTYQQTQQLIGHSDSIWALAVHKNFIYSASDDQTIKVWDLSNYQCIHTITQENSTKILSISGITIQI